MVSSLKFDNPIRVTRPFLPPLDSMCKGLGEIWDNGWLTNNGPVLQRYTSALERYFETDNVCLFSNGTMALQIALQGMGVTGEVITTPFTFVATSHALHWNGITPVFCDIEPDHFTLDPKKVEELITPKTSAILAVHVFGHPCNLEALADIARRHGLKLLYDAAHAFGVRVGGVPITEHGDLSMVSFHATKLYHSIEGGMLIFQEPSLKQLFDYLKNFGFKNELEVVMPGTNAKMNEFQALMGLQCLDYVEDIIERRRRIYALYRNRLEHIAGVNLPPDPDKDIEYNYAYVPVQVDEYAYGMTRDELYEALKEFNIFSRRYFYPLLNELESYSYLPLRDGLEVATRVAKNILTLPTYHELRDEDVLQICDVIEYLHQSSVMATKAHSLGMPACCTE